MDRKISLSWFLSLSFLGIALLPVVGYAFLSLSFFGKGLDSIISANLAQAVQLYAADTPAAGRRGLQNVNGLEVAPPLGGYARRGARQSYAAAAGRGALQV